MHQTTPLLPAGLPAVSLDEQGPPGPEGFTEGSARGEGEDAAPAEPAPALTWQPAQLAADLALAKQLMQTVDKEKGVEGNPLQPAAVAGEGGDDAATGGGGEGQQQEGAEAGGPADMDAELSPAEQQAKLDQVGTLSPFWLLVYKLSEIRV